MKKYAIIVALSGTLLSATVQAQQSSTSASGATAGSSSNASSSPVVTTSASTSSQSTAQSGASSTNAGNAQSITNNSYTPARQTIVAAPSVFAPALTTTLTETCMGSSSLGVSVLGFGLGGGTTWQDHECVRRLNARELAQTLNDKEAAREVICGNEEVFRVYNALGRPCKLRPDGSANPAWVAPPPVVAAATVAPVPAVRAPERSYMVFFDFGSAALTPNVANTLDGVAVAYKQAGNVEVVVAGHTDRAGSAQYNQQLSKQRAEAVRGYLLAKGIPDEMQKIIAMGESAPLVKTADGVAEARNRRVEITFGPTAGF